MLTKPGKTIVSKFPLRLPPSVRSRAEGFSEKEGISLNQFIQLAVAEKVARLEHEEWVARRREPVPERIAAALAVLDMPSENAPSEDDRLPEDYRSVSDRFDELKAKIAEAFRDISEEEGNALIEAAVREVRGKK